MLGAFADFDWPTQSTPRRGPRDVNRGSRVREMRAYGIGGTEAVKHSAEAGRAPAGC
jgi:hypothetical protein